MPLTYTPLSTKESCDNLRRDVKILCVSLSGLKQSVAASPVKEGENRGEVMANLTLAFRHLEDAAMRVGKAIQADQGGESPLGGPSTPGAIKQ